MNRPAADHRLKLQDSIGVLLLRHIFGAYVLIAVVLTAGHIVVEYFHFKSLAQKNLQQAELILRPLFEEALWHLDEELLVKASQGSLNFPSVAGVLVIDSQVHVLMELGEISPDHQYDAQLDLDGNPRWSADQVTFSENLFEHAFKLTSPIDPDEVIGEVHLYSSESLVLERVRYSLLLISFNALLKTTALWIIFLWFARRLLSRPLQDLIQATSRLDLENEQSLQRVELPSKSRNELSVLVETFHEMTSRLILTNQKRHAAEEALRASEQRLKLAIESAHLGVWDLNLETNELVVNEEWAQRSGCSIEEALPFPGVWESRIHPEDREFVMQVYRQHFSKPLPSEFLEYRIQRPDGTECWVVGFGKVVERDSTGTPVRMLGVELDITQRKLSEVQLRELYEQLEKAHQQMQQAQAQALQAAKLASLGEMATSIAHELKQPLSFISLSSELLVQLLDPEQQKKAHQLAQRIGEQNDKAVHIIQHLRNFGRDSRKDAHQDIDLNQLVENSQELFASHIKKHLVEVHLELSADLPPVHGDPVQIEQVLTNLVLNATDAMKERPLRKLTLRTREISEHDELWQQAQQELEKPLSKNDTWVALEVGDTGGGIEEAHVHEIFQSFFTTKPPGEGTGLGLAISKGIVASHGGVLLLKNTPGEGVTFSLLLRKP